MEGRLYNNKDIDKKNKTNLKSKNKKIEFENFYSNWKKKDDRINKCEGENNENNQLNDPLSDSIKHNIIKYNFSKEKIDNLISSMTETKKVFRFLFK